MITLERVPCTVRSLQPAACVVYHHTTLPASQTESTAPCSHLILVVVRQRAQESGSNNGKRARAAPAQQSPHYSSFDPADGFALRLRERFDPKRPSSIPGVGVGVGRGEPCAALRPTIGENERRPGVGACENEETCRRMTNSCVAFVSCTILVRSVDESALALAFVAALGCAAAPGPEADGVAAAAAAEAAAADDPPVMPRVLRALDSWMTV